MSDPRALSIVQDFLKAVASDFDVVEGYLFGSRARNDFRDDSDADVAVIIRTPQGSKYRTVGRLGEKSFDFLIDHQIDIQPVVIWLYEWENPQNNTNISLIKNIRRDGISLLE